MTKILRNPVENFWSDVFKTNTCWYWVGDIAPSGYGKIMFRKNGETKNMYAHRLSYEFYFGKIPEGLFVLHTCDNRQCVKPEHLFLGTALDNTTDMIEKGRMSCGEKRKNAKLTAEQVLEIRHLAAQGARNIELVKQFGVNRPTITKIVKGERWKHLLGIKNGR